jgi:D-alanyl-lipoteichoic acid biosynthesis protein DltD
MKQLVLVLFLPFLISLFALCYLTNSSSFNQFLFSYPEPNNSQNHEPLNFVENFALYPEFESEFLKDASRNKRIFILGSSELAAASPALPYNFISANFSTQVIGVGHAGNQCLSIYAQLLAHEELLKNRPIVILLSPGWFESKPAKGTSSAVFLEYNSYRFLDKIIYSRDSSRFPNYLNSRIAQLYSEFTSPSLELNWMNLKHRSSKSIVHQALYSPILFCDSILLQQKAKILSQQKNNPVKKLTAPTNPLSVNVNWDSIFRFSQEEVLRKSTNNELGIEDSYYTEYIHGKTGSIQAVPISSNQELIDFKMLIKLLKSKQAAVSFVITPLNPYYYKNLNDLDPMIDALKHEIKMTGFPCFNLFESKTKNYEKALLHDVMHLSDYGWYKVNKFIVDTYTLENEKKIN